MGFFKGIIGNIVYIKVSKMPVKVSKMGLLAYSHPPISLFAYAY